MSRGARAGAVVVAALLLLVVGTVAPAPARAQAQSTRILLMYGVPPESPSIAQFSQRMRETIRLGTSSHVEFYEEFLDLERFPARERELELSAYFAEKYRRTRIDLVVAVGSVALRFAEGGLATALPQSPIIFALVTDPPTRLPAGVTGRYLPIDFERTIDMARRLQPKVRRVVVVAGVGIHDSIASEGAVQTARRLGYTIEIVRNRSYDATLARLRELPSNSLVLLCYFRPDGSGRSYVSSELIARMARESKTPIYGVLGTWLGQGMVGGAVIPFDREGEQTGRLALRILGRRAGAPLPAPDMATSELVADWRALNRWDLAERRLPAGTDVRHRAPTIWQRLRVAVLIVAGVLLAQMGLILMMLAERRRRARAQRELAEQVAVERELAALTADASRFVPGAGRRARERLLSRVGRLSGARLVRLVEFAEAPSRQPQRTDWPHGVDDSFATRLDVPLRARGVTLGALELYREQEEGPWPASLEARVQAAAELIAGAISRTRAEAALRRGEELNRAVLASLSAQIAILDQSGTIVRVNETWRTIATAAGSAGAFVGRSYLEECSRAEARGCEEAGDVRRGIEAVLDHRAVTFHFEYHQGAPEVRWYELVVDRLEHAAGGAVVAHLDITARRLAELRTDEARRQLAHVGRVALVGELAAVLAHELRQPLGAIRMNAEVGARLAERALPAADGDEARAAESSVEPVSPDPEDPVEIFRDIVSDADRANDVIEHVRALLRDEAPRRDRLELGDVCRHAVRLVQHDALLHRTRLDLVIDEDAPPVLADPVELQQVVLNLTLNAIEAASGPEAAEDRVVTVGTERRGEEVALTVRDSGAGFTPDTRRNLFEAFHSTKPTGLGLGLVIVRSIVERHHGRVEVEDAPGGGALFRVLLPADAPVTPAAHRA